MSDELKPEVSASQIEQEKVMEIIGKMLVILDGEPYSRVVSVARNLNEWVQVKSNKVFADLKVEFKEGDKII